LSLSGDRYRKQKNWSSQNQSKTNNLTCGIAPEKDFSIPSQATSQPVSNGVIKV
jgi:hypothetical protein